MSSETKTDNPTPVLTRRKLLYGMGLAAAAVPLGQFLAACGAGTDGSGTDTPDPMDSVVDPGAWATGGTKAMTALSSYPDPFAVGLGSACALTCEATLGPCYATTVEREDITEGEDGLPVRLAFLIVDETCKPIPGATLDIWHCGPDGLYSGEDASDFCTTGDTRARSARWYRGVQTTDANGRVNFNTCFPGWYSSRTVHIHFTVRLNNQEYVTSQFVFDDVLDDEIINSQPLYNTRGPRDTTNATDNVVSAESAPEYSFQTKRMADGAMLAWKTIVIRSSLSNASCSVPGGGGGGGGPRPPGDGGMGPPPGGRDGGGMGPPPGWDGGTRP
ncbi:protocatechuate 3,4-dioxygenase [Cystobacter fuscus]|uniref:dioxygenase family protein n=1 Tax=Cystobacter fuscus TaxID=43 RepID=UPI002B2FD3C5|nr:protocatechuate 3,4-dioxygenase [Cystobacter fuscus]